MDGTEKPLVGIKGNVNKIKRTDVNEYFDCPFDYSNCGFSAEFDLKELDLASKEYQIIFKPDSNDYDGIPSNGYIYNNELSFISSDDKVDLNVEGTDIEEIVKKGYCLASCPDDHIFIYQYNNCIYWIATNQYEFEKDGSTVIQYQLETTQYDRLPISRTENGWYWDHISDDFEKFEVTDNMNCGEYRVSVREIPKQYSVVRIITGYYVNGKWVWKRYLRPCYLYK